MDQEARNKGHIRSRARSQEAPDRTLAAVVRIHLEHRIPEVVRTLEEADRTLVEAEHIQEVVRSLVGARSRAVARNPEAQFHLVAACIREEVLLWWAEEVAVAEATLLEEQLLLAPGAAEVAFGQTRGNSAGA